MNKMLMRMIAASFMMNRMAEDGDGGAGGGGDDGGGGGGGDSYYSGFPEDVQGWDEVKNSETPEAFWQQMGSHRQHIGQSIRIPGPDAGKEDWDAFNAKMTDKVPTLMQTPDLENAESLNALYARMGKPESADKYSIPEIKDAEGKAIEGLDHTATEGFRELALANGLTQTQFSGIVEKMTAKNIADATAANAALATEQAAITALWGTAEDKNYTILQNFAKTTDAPPEVVAAIADKRMNKSTAEWMLKAANASFSSKGGAASDESGVTGVMTPAEATERHAEIMNNKAHPYWNKLDPGHKAALARVRDLIIAKNPAPDTQAAPGGTFAPAGMPQE